MPGRETGWFLPGMFAVGGGTNPVLACPVAGELVLLGVFFGELPPAGFVLDCGVPPYFFNNSCVVLYFVAALSFSIVASLCFCNPSD